MLCLLVWALCAALIIESIVSIGVGALLLAPLPLLASAVVWALLWAPRVVVHPDRIEVRNVLVTHLLPMASIDHVRLGAMLRFDLVPADDTAKPVTISAWNAPGVGKGRHGERLSNIRQQQQAGQMGPKGTDWARSNLQDPSQRLVQDQELSSSHAAVEAWETWRRRARKETDGDATATVDDAAAPTRSMNIVQIGVVAGAALLLGLVVAIG